jgi:ATP-dependent DNA helicase RecG
VPTKYEIPQEVVAEAIVNAVVHRDYTSNASVQVMLFKDRLEVWNPGTLPPTLTLEKLRGPHASVPYNPLLAEPMYLTKYIERMGTGIRDMIRRCRAVGLPELEIRIDGGFFVLTIRRKKPGAGTKSGPSQDQVTPQDTQQVTPQVRALLGAIVDAPHSRGELQEAVGIKDREHFRKAYLEPLLTVTWIERTIPDKPTSRLQKYRLTEKGHSLLEQLEKKRGRP